MQRAEALQAQVQFIPWPAGTPLGRKVTKVRLLVLQGTRVGVTKNRRLEVRLLGQDPPVVQQAAQIMSQVL